MVELVTSDGDTFKIGQRVMIAGGSGSNTGATERGTIRYIGPIPPNEGTWLGIDWDNPSRGKHDGVHNGVRYFTARHPTSGSFVKKEKIDSGKSCVEAIKLRYGVNVHGSDVEEQLQQVKKAFNAPFLEMVGFEDVNKKQSCFETLRVVWLHDYGVSNAGKPNELKELSPRIKELDLSKNLLSSWHDVVAITCQLGNLHLLNLSENMLVVPDENEIHELSKQDAFRSLQYLILSTMEYTWSDILHCASLWPNIQHLQAPFNIITSLELPEKPVLYNLRQLDLEGNKIENWGEINKLGMLPLLERLNLVNTDMSNILIPGDVNLFCSLKHLLLSQNKISSWRDINELDKLKLQDLRFRDNPVLREYSKETSRQLIIAKIASIKMLDGQEIFREERRGAEYDYIKRNGKQWQESKDDAKSRAAFLKEHPRYTTLITKYGEAESSEYKEVKNKLKSSLIKLEIIAQPTDKVITKSLPRSMLVQKLVGLVQKLFNTGTIIPNLSVLSSKHPDLKITLDNHLKNLDFYSVEDGDKILVEW